MIFVSQQPKIEMDFGVYVPFVARGPAASPLFRWAFDGARKIDRRRLDDRSARLRPIRPSVADLQAKERHHRKLGVGGHWSSARRWPTGPFFRADNKGSLSDGEMRSSPVARQTRGLKEI